MTSVDVVATARSEFRAAFHWYRDRSPHAGRRFALEVKSSIAAIRQHPERFARWDDAYRFRMLDRFPYYVAYRHTSELVVIVAIRHAAQDQDAWRGR
jgi:plasmid stabilization system protein ParE